MKRRRLMVGGLTGAVAMLTGGVGCRDISEELAAERIKNQEKDRDRKLMRMSAKVDEYGVLKSGADKEVVASWVESINLTIQRTVEGAELYASDSGRLFRGVDLGFPDWRRSSLVPQWTLGLVQAYTNERSYWVFWRSGLLLPTQGEAREAFKRITVDEETEQGLFDHVVKEALPHFTYAVPDNARAFPKITALTEKIKAAAIDLSPEVIHGSLP